MPIVSNFGEITLEGFHHYSQSVLTAAKALDRDSARQFRFLEARFDDIEGMLEGTLRVFDPIEHRCVRQMKVLQARVLSKGSHLCREDYLGFFVNLSLMTHTSTLGCERKARG